MNLELGTDIVSISRIEKVITKFGISFLERFLLPSEILLTHRDKARFPQTQFLYDVDSNNPCKLDYVNKNNTNYIPKFFSQKSVDKYTEDTSYILKEIKQNFSLNTYRIETIAGFWSAKEACAKALGTGIGRELGFHDICIIKDKNGKPHIAIHQTKWYKFNLQKLAISISHDIQMAFAVCAVILKHN